MTRTSRRPGSARGGLTLIELLVVVAIVALLLGILLPAVQKVRDAGNRTTCRNHLRQIGIAAHQYHDNHSAFPPGMTYQNGNHPQPFLGWHARLLPFLEQDAIWRAIEAAFRTNRDFLQVPPHIERKAVITVFGCPSDRRAKGPTPFGVGTTSFLGVAGLDQTTLDGIFFVDSRVGTGDIADGLSNTLMVGERPPTGDGELGWWYAGHGQALNGSAEMLLGVREFRSFLPYITECLRGPYRFEAGEIDAVCDAFHFWSPHPGGANFALADGSVRFLRYSADSIMPALASRAGGESEGVP